MDDGRRWRKEAMKMYQLPATSVHVVVLLTHGTSSMSLRHRLLQVQGSNGLHHIHSP
jgi:hypothetical protein